MILKGTKFQVKVWKYLLKIPKGKVKTYKQIAAAIKKPNSARAVGNALQRQAVKANGQTEATANRGFSNT